jgi:hypothetical protein
MATESITAAGITLTKHYESYGVFLTLIDGTSGGSVLAIGQKVKISANNTVVKCSAGTDFSIGVVTNTDNGDGSNKVTVHANIMRDSKAVAIGGTLNAGAFVVPNGVMNADGIPQYVAAASGDHVSAIVLSGGAANSVIRILHLRSSFKN